MESHSHKLHTKVNSTEDLRLIQAFFATPLTPPPSAPSSAPPSCTSSPVQTRRRSNLSSATAPLPHTRRLNKNSLPCHLESQSEDSPVMQSSATRAVFYSSAFSPF